MVPLAIPITGLFFAFSEGFGRGDSPLEAFFMFAVLGLTYGAIFWIPAVLGCFIIEAVAVGTKSTQLNVAIAFLIEWVLASAIMAGIFNEGFLDLGAVVVAAAIGATQLLRWWYLKHKNRMYKFAAPQLQEDVLDEIDL